MAMRPVRRSGRLEGALCFMRTRSIASDYRDHTGRITEFHIDIKMQHSAGTWCPQTKTSRICSRLPDHESHHPRATELYSGQNICFDCVARVLEQQLPMVTQYSLIEEVAATLQNLPAPAALRISHHLLHYTAFVDVTVRSV